MHVAVDVGVTVDEFVGERVGHVNDVEFLFLLAYAGVEKHMEQDIAELFADFGVILADECVAEFEYLFDRVGAQ